MAKFYKQDSIEALLLQVDIIDIISERIQLVKSGSSFKACCPFHQEKTPSFMIDPRKKIFKCFGCGIGGNSVKFLMEYEGTTFVETIEYLAQKYHFTLESDQQQTTQEGIRQKILRINEYTLAFFRESLQREHQTLSQYLNKRGLGTQELQTFQIGHAPDNYTALYNHLKKHHFSDNDLLSAGVITRTQRGNLIDRFRDRLIFPIFNELSRLVGFGGRRLKKQEGIPKYLNSSETALYQKSHILYGLSLGKRAIQTQKEVIVVEGYMDLIALHKVGIEHVVAPCGTAMTDEQLKLLKRFANKIIFCFDGDHAGEQAALKQLGSCLRNDINGTVITLPLGQDPDTYIASFGKAAFLDFINRQEQEILDFYINIQKKDKNELTIVKDLFPVIDTLDDQLNRSYLIKRLSKKLGFTVEDIETTLKKRKHRHLRRDQETPVVAVVTPPSRMEKQVKQLELEILSILFKFPDLLNHQMILKFDNEQIMMILGRLLEANQQNRYLSKIDFMDTLSGVLSLKQLVYLKEYQPMLSLDHPEATEEHIGEILYEYLQRLESFQIKRDIQLLKKELQEIQNHIKETQDQDLLQILNEKTEQMFLLVKRGNSLNQHNLQPSLGG